MFASNKSARAVYVGGVTLIPGQETDISELSEEQRSGLKGIEGVEISSKSSKKGAQKGDEMSDADRVESTRSGEVAPHSGDEKATEKAQSEAAKQATGRGK